MGGGVLQGLSGVGRHQLTQLARLAEGQRAQAVLNTLRLQAQPTPTSEGREEGGGGAVRLPAGLSTNEW